MPKRTEPPPKKAPAEIRNEIKNYIRNERDTILRKWMALEESMRAEDRQRENFIAWKTREDTFLLPLTIKKLIGNLTKAVRKKMRDHGGTPHSILRQMFMYWDADRSGMISSHELKLCLKSLGVNVKDEEIDEIMKYYAHGKCQDEFEYNQILKDIQKDEPSIVADVGTRDDNADIEVRFEEVGDNRPPMPAKVKFFIEATQNYIANKLRMEGGTPPNLLLKIFQKADLRHTGVLNAPELVFAATGPMKLSMSLEDARLIINYYDVKKSGELHYEDLVHDVCSGVPSILAFPELSPRQIASTKQRVASNPFVPVPFKAAPSKLIERIRREVGISLNLKMANIGGSLRSWITETFHHWDPRNTGKITKFQDVVGIMKKLGVEIIPEEATALMNAYCVDGTGHMTYRHFMDDLLAGDPHFTTDATDFVKTSTGISATARAPEHISKYIERLKRAADKFSMKSKGVLRPRDILHGTFLRFDDALRGLIGVRGFVDAARELGVTVSEGDANAVVMWFDMHGTQELDYNELTTQLYGADIITKSCSLPTLSTKSLSGSGSNSLLSPIDFGTGAKPFENLGGKHGEEKKYYIETRAIKDARKTINRSLALKERHKVQSKIESIDLQRKQLIDEYKARKAQEPSS